MNIKISKNNLSNHSFAGLDSYNKGYKDGSNDTKKAILVLLEISKKEENIYDFMKTNVINMEVG